MVSVERSPKGTANCGLAVGLSSSPRSDVGKPDRHRSRGDPSIPARCGSRPRTAASWLRPRSEDGPTRTARRSLAFEPSMTFVGRTVRRTSPGTPGTARLGSGPDASSGRSVDRDDSRAALEGDAPAHRRRPRPLGRCPSGRPSRPRGLRKVRMTVVPAGRASPTDKSQTVPEQVNDAGRNAGLREHRQDRARQAPVTIDHGDGHVLDSAASEPSVILNRTSAP